MIYKYRKNPGPPLRSHLGKAQAQCCPPLWGHRTIQSRSRSRVLNSFRRPLVSAGGSGIWVAPCAKPEH